MNFIMILLISLTIISCNDNKQQEPTHSTSSDLITYKVLNKLDITESLDSEINEHIVDCKEEKALSKVNKKSKEKNKNIKSCVLLCHVPPGNPSQAKTKILPLSAISGHIHAGRKHNDYLGPCVIEVSTADESEIIIDSPVNETPIETPVQEEVIVPPPVVEAPVQEEVIVPPPVVEAPVQEEVIVPPPVVEAPVQEEVIVPPPVVEAPVQEEVIVPPPVVEAPVQEEELNNSLDVDVENNEEVFTPPPVCGNNYNDVNCDGLDDDTLQPVVYSEADLQFAL